MIFVNTWDWSQDYCDRGELAGAPFRPTCSTYSGLLDFAHRVRPEPTGRCPAGVGDVVAQLDLAVDQLT